MTTRHCEKCGAPLPDPPLIHSERSCSGRIGGLSRSAAKAAGAVVAAHSPCGPGKRRGRKKKIADLATG